MARAQEGRRGSMADDALEHILEDIIQCRIRPGDMVQLSELAKKYEMSKTPVREALRLLERDGLVTSIPYKGYVISTINREDIDDIYFMRRLLEGAAAEEAASRITDEELARLSALEAPDTVTMTLDYDRYAGTFHAIVAEASGRTRLARQVQHVYNDIRRLQYAGVGRPRPVEITEEHQRITDALRDRDGSKAKALMVEHIEKVYKRATE